MVRLCCLGFFKRRYLRVFLHRFLVELLVEYIMHITYVSPRVLSRVAIQMECSLLQASVQDALNLGGVDATHQEVENIDFNENPFQHEWQ